MTIHGIFIPRQIGAMNVDIWNRHAIAGSTVGVDIDNGSVFPLIKKSGETDEFEVWVAGSPTSSASGTDVLWMAYSGEDFMPSLQVTGGANDIHNFTNTYGKVFPAYKPQLHDLITLSASALSDFYAPGDLYIHPFPGQLKMKWDTEAGSGLAYKLIQTTTFAFGSTSLNSNFSSGRETAYIFECVQTN